MLTNHLIHKSPYEVVFIDGTFVIVTTLDQTKIVNAYLRKYGILPKTRVADHYNVPWYYNKVEE